MARGLQASLHPWFEPAMLVGVKAGSFTLENVLGSGGFGAVYSTRSEQGQPLAVKVLFPPRSRESADMADSLSILQFMTGRITPGDVESFQDYLTTIRPAG